MATQVNITRHVGDTTAPLLRFWTDEISEVVTCR